MFKKSDHKDTRPPKQEAANETAKAEAPTETPAPAPDKELSPANEENKA